MPLFNFLRNMTPAERQALTTSLLGMSAQLLQPSRVPRSTLGDISGALAGGVQNYYAQMAAQQEQQRQQQEQAIQNQYRQSMIADMEAKRKQTEQQAAQRAQLAQRIGAPMQYGIEDQANQMSQMLEGTPVSLARQGITDPLSEILLQAEMQGLNVPGVGDFMPERQKPLVVGRSLVSPEGRLLYESTKEPEKESWTDYGYGQKRNLRTGEVVKVPTAPRESKTGGEAGGAEMAKVGNLTAVRESVNQKYFPIAMKNINANPDKKVAMEALQALKDPMTGGVNSARLYESLLPEERKHYDWVMLKAQKYASTMSPAEAVNTALSDWREARKGKAATASAGTSASTPPAATLREGLITTYKNGQQWTLQGGKPTRIK